MEPSYRQRFRRPPPLPPGHGRQHRKRRRGRAVGALDRAQAVALIRLAYLMLGDRAAAEDVVQDAFCGLYLRWDRLTDPSSALPYVRSSATKWLPDGPAPSRRPRPPGHRVPATVGIRRGCCAQPRGTPEEQTPALRQRAHAPGRGPGAALPQPAARARDTSLFWTPDRGNARSATTSGAEGARPSAGEHMYHLRLQSRAPRRTPRDGGRDPCAGAPTGPEPPAAGAPERQVGRDGGAAGRRGPGPRGRRRLPGRDRKPDAPAGHRRAAGRPPRCPGLRRGADHREAPLRRSQTISALPPSPTAPPSSDPPRPARSWPGSPRPGRTCRSPG